MSEIKMPRLGETVTEGVIVKWLKNEGDKVEKEEPIVEISTDKVETDIPAQEDGVLTQIMAEEGKKVLVGDIIGKIKSDEQDEVEPEPQIVKAEAKVVSEEGQPAKEARHVLSPLVRRLAEEKNVDLKKVEGTGTHGRIRKDDVLEYAARSETVEKKKTIAPSKRTYKSKPLTAIRKQIAEHMMESKKSTAAVSAIVEVDFEAVDALRNKYKEDFEKSEGFSLTYLPYLARAVVQALEKWPVFNSELINGEVLAKPNINLGIAVSIEEGLIVPVIKKTEQLNILGLARAINDIATRARSGKLSVDEVHEGTFTITNNGSFGSLIQTPIIVPGQVAILSFEAITSRVVAIDDVIAIRKRAYLPLTYDHQVVDGAEAGRFLRDLKNIIEKADFSREFNAGAA